MLVIGFECRTACGSCGAAVPINAAVPTVFCPSCARPINLTPAGMAEMLKPALAAPERLAENHGSRGTVWTPDGQFELTYTRMAPRCEYCGHPVDADASAADRGWIPCPGCEASLSVREVPEAIRGALPDVAVLVGEDAEQLAAGGATSFASRQAAPVSCGQCGGALEVDGTARTIGCSYCGATVVIPDGVWARLHPVTAVRRWFAAITVEARPEIPGSIEPGRDQVWSSVRQAIADDRAVYAVGTWDGERAVWAFDPRTMQVRWRRGGLALEHDAGVALAPGGRLIAWDDEHHHGQVFNAADGLPAGTVGGREPPGASIHHLDFVNLASFAACPDGSFVALFESRLLRFDPRGVGVPTWPESGGFRGLLQQRQRPAPLWRASPQRPPGSDADDWDAKRQRAPIKADALGFDWMSASLKGCGSRAQFFGWNARPTIAVGWDGRLYVEGESSGSDRALVCFEPDGEQRYAVDLPTDDVEWGARPAAAADGTAYSLGSVDHDHKTLVQIRADGALRELARDTRLGGPLVADVDQVVAVSPTNIAVVLGEDGGCKVFAPDGRVLAMSDRSRSVLGV